MPRFFKILLVALAVGLTAACTQRVTFDVGSPYNSPHKLKKAALVAFPDDLQEEVYTVRVGAFLDRKTFAIPVLDAYRAESIARLSGFFTEGVTVVTHSLAEEVTAQLATAGDAPAEEPEKTDLEKVLAEIKAKKTDSSASEKTDAELNEQLFAEVGKETIRDKAPDYLVWYEDAILGFDRSRVAVSFRVQVLDQRTSVILLDKRYNGFSRRFEPGNNEKTNMIKLQDLTREAFAGSMGQLLEDLAEVTGAR